MICEKKALAWELEERWCDRSSEVLVTDLSDTSRTVVNKAEPWEAALGFLK